MARGKKTGGRVIGSQNKSTANAREAIARFVDDNSSRLQGWLDKIEDEQGALMAFKCVQDLIEYHVPKLARLEHTGKDGKDLTLVVKPADVEVL